MLRKKEEKKEKVKDEAYYSMKLEELRTKSENLSLMVRGADENRGTCQITYSMCEGFLALSCSFCVICNSNAVVVTYCFHYLVQQND